MCYLIELKDKYLKKEYITLTVEKKEGIKINNVKWTMTSDHDFLGVFNNVCFKKTGTKLSSVLLLHFVPVFLKQTLCLFLCKTFPILYPWS